MIDSVTVDFWNTLISNTPEDARRFHRLRTKGIVQAFVSKGIKIQEKQVGEALDLCFQKCWDIWTENVDLTSREQIQILMSLLPYAGERHSPDLLEKIEKAYTEAVIESPPALIEGSFEILDYLKDEEYKLGLICNTGRSPGKLLRKLMRHHRILHYFDGLTFSDELKIRKPDPRIFLFTLKNLKSTPSSSIHVGDELQTDVKGAKDAGMTAIHFNRGNPHLQEIQPDYSIRGLREIKRILRMLRES